MWGWLAPIIITLLAGVLQFWSLTTPHKITFDETYYAKDAYSLLVKHYAGNFVNDGNDDNGSEADKIINPGIDEGHLHVGPNKVVHPEVGKWMIAGRRVALRDDAVRLAVLVGLLRHADGA